MSGPKTNRRWIPAVARLALLGFSLAFVVVILEVAFRAVPSLLPPGSYGGGRYEATLRGNVHAGPVIYNKVRFVRRVPNADGFMDVDHAKEAAAGTTRVAFFGDSYVESLQVPLDQVFFRVLEKQLEHRFETFGFGISGWGTFNALHAWQTYGPRYGIDHAVYLFVGNDLGDQLEGVAAEGNTRALLRPDGDGFQIRWPIPPEGASLSRRIGKFIQRHSFVARLARQRAMAIRRTGVRIGVDRDEVEMSGEAGAVPGPNDLPSTWPTEYSERARALGRTVLAEFAAKTREAGVGFSILYVPRGETQLTGEVAAEDTWLPWLRETCETLGIELIDPSAALRAELASGTSVYDDHWTPAGHAVIADVLAERLRNVRAAR